MTLSSRKIYLPRSFTRLFFPVLLFLTSCATVPPLAEVAAADAAIKAAEAAAPRGTAAEMLREAKRRQDAAQRTLAEKKYPQARLLTEQALAAAELAQAQAALAAARDDVDSKAARNADLRRTQMREGN